MHLHQVLTGAVNPGDCCYSVGCVNDIPFTAYGSGCDVVILASDFDCVQIIPGAQNGNIQVGCVECSQQLGRIAASYGNTVCIFEPLSTNPNKLHKINYQWQKTGQFFLDAITYNLSYYHHREPYLGSHRATPAVGSTIERCPHRGGGWAGE
uniref:DmX-like protein 2 n=1 Tax=Oryzias latipes TaxID=8090 RepID=A0A3P9LIC4_ORYLA